MKRQHSYLKLTKKKVNPLIFREAKKCKRCLEIFTPPKATLYCGRCREVLDER